MPKGNTIYKGNQNDLNSLTKGYINVNEFKTKKTGEIGVVKPMEFETKGKILILFIYVSIFILSSSKHFLVYFKMRVEKRTILEFFF